MRWAPRTDGIRLRQATRLSSPNVLRRDRLYGTDETNGTYRDSLIGPMCPISPIRARPAELAGPLTISGRSGLGFFKKQPIYDG
jgi:hypothetical protein